MPPTRSDSTTALIDAVIRYNAAGADHPPAAAASASARPAGAGLVDRVRAVTRQSELAAARRVPALPRRRVRRRPDAPAALPRRQPAASATPSRSRPGSGAG